MSPDMTPTPGVDPIEGEWLRFRETLSDEVSALAPEQVDDARMLFYCGARAALFAVFRDGMAGAQSFGFAVVLDRLTKARAELNAFTGAIEARVNEDRPLCSRRPVAAPEPTADKPPALSVQAFKWAASKTPPEELAREVFFLRSGDARREAIALGAIRRVSEWVESGADFDLVLDKQNLARPSTAPVHIERDPAFDATQLSEHWEPLDVHRDLWGVFLAGDDTARPLAIFTEEVEAYDWLGFMAKHPVEHRRFGGGDKCVCVIRDLSARTWNHLSPVPSRESESSS